jgi:hypothetical protein
VLDRTADADGDVELGRDDLAGLADLQFVRHVPGVDRGARGAHRRAELVGEVVDDLEVLRRTDTAATGHHALGALQVRAIRLAGRQADEARVRRQRRIALAVSTFALPPARRLPATKPCAPSRRPACPTAP